jgi:hypothetical protein
MEHEARAGRKDMSDAHQPLHAEDGGDGPPPSRGSVVIPRDVQRIRRQLYWQSVYVVLYVALNLYVIVLYIQYATDLTPAIGAGIFVAGSAVAAASIILGRRVTLQRRSTRSTIILLCAAVGATYGLLAVRSIALGSTSSAVLNVPGLWTAASVLRYALGSEAKSWFSTP